MKHRWLSNLFILALTSALVVSTFLFASPMNVSAIQAQRSYELIADQNVQAAAGRTVVRWFVGLGTGSDPEQIPIQQQVVDEFNASQNDILLVVEFVPNNVAHEALAAEIAQGEAPDIVGPAGWAAAAPFHGQWLDLAPLIASSGFDTSIFDPTLLNAYQTDEGQVGLPFEAFPAAIYYKPVLFDNAGLNHPPVHYGDLYTMPDTTQVEWNWDTVAQVSKLLTLDVNGHNALSPDFDKTQVEQYGFSFQWQNQPTYWGSYWQSGGLYQGAPSSYTAQVPAAWQDAWSWVYDGMWSDQRFIPNGLAEANLGNNVFASGKVAMAEAPHWYLCCLGDFVGNGGTFQLAAMPKLDGQVAGRVDADTFRILKNTPHPNEAFRALSYLVTTGVDKLMFGSETQDPAYWGAISAITAKQGQSLDRRKADYPFVTQESWDVLLDGLNYPDVPSAEAWMPNYLASSAYLQNFANTLMNTDGLELSTEISTLESDLTTLFNQAEPPLTTRTVVRWFVGLGTGTDPSQIPMQREVADDFNASQSELLLVMEIVPYGNAREALMGEMEQGIAPDIIGPVGWGGSNAFYGQWLDIAPLITSTGFDTSIFNPALVNMYQTEEGLVGLPFSVFPSAIYYNPALFDAAGVNYPPAHYGDQYVMPDNSVVDWNLDTVRNVSRLLTLDAGGHNATSSSFDKTQIVQYGFTFGWSTSPKYIGSYWQSGQLLQGTAEPYSAVFPNAWKDALDWYYNGVWGNQRFIPNAAAGGRDSSIFNNGNIAMLENPLWMTCCLNTLVDNGGTFQFGAMPSYNGQVAGRIDADTFRIWKNTTHANEAFQAMTYLVTTGVDKLIVGTESQLPAYGGFPAITSKLQPALDLRAIQFPFVTQESWNIMVAGLNYPDVPNAETWMPNFTTAWNHLDAFGAMLSDTRGLNLDNEIAALEDELTLIFNYGSIPSSPILLAPAAGEQLLNNRPAFDWTDMPKALAYNIQISRNATFSDLVTNTVVAGSSYTPTTDLPANKTLRWRVRTKWSGGYSPWSEARLIDTANPPSIPVLISPATNSLTTDYTPTFDWNDSVLPLPLGSTAFDHYQIQVDDDADFSSTVIDENTTSSNYPVTTALDPNTKYSWRVRVYNTAGEYSSWSFVWTLRTALTQPVLISPINDVHLNTLQPVFDWEDVPEAAGYTIQVSTSSTFSTIAHSANVFVSTYTPVVNLPQGKLYWRVRATGMNPSAWSANSYQGPYPPAVPTLSLPANNALLIASTVSFKWSALTIPPGAPAFDKYQLEVATDSGFSSLIVQQDIPGVANNQFTPVVTFNPNTKYYWHVRGVNTLPQNGNWSATWSFRIRMDAPVLVSPADGSDELTLRPTFDWNDIPGPGAVTGYTIQISRNIGFTQIVHTGNSVASIYTPTVDMPKGIPLYWRVQGKGANGPSAWSTPRSFNSANSPSAPVLSAPALNLLLTDDTPLLKWGAVTLPATTSFQYYQVQVDDDPGFGSTAIDDTSITVRTTTQLQIPDVDALNHNTKYYWRVRAINTANEVSNWSAVWYFRIRVDAPTLLSPLNGSPAGTLQPSFDWTDATGPGQIISYTIQISTSPTFGTLIVNTSTGPSNYQRPSNLPSGKTFYWRVKVNGANGPSVWSPVFSFTTP